MAPPYKFKGLGGRQSETTAQAHGTIIPKSAAQRASDGRMRGFGSAGEAADEAGGATLVHGAAQAVSRVLERGALRGDSGRKMSEMSSRVMAAFSGGQEESNIRTSPRSISESAAYKNGLNADTFAAAKRESTNSFFKGDTGWWDRNMESRGQTKESWSAASDPGLGAKGEKSWDYQTDAGLGYVAPKAAAAPAAFGAQPEVSDEEKVTLGQVQEFATLSGKGAGGELFDSGMRSLARVSVQPEVNTSGFSGDYQEAEVGRRVGQQQVGITESLFKSPWDLLNGAESHA